MSNELEQLENQIAELQARKQTILDGQRKLVLDEMRNNIRLYGFTATELGLGGTKSAKAKSTASTDKQARYANPANPLQTWRGGKGPKPAWVKAQLAAGKSLENLRIKA